MGLVVACPVHGLIFEQGLLHKISKGMALSFDLYLQQALCSLQNVDFQLIALASEGKSSARRRLSTFLQTLHRSMWPERTSSFPHFEQYPLMTPRSRPTVVSFGMRWLVSMTFALMTSLGLVTSNIDLSKRGLELETWSIPVKGSSIFLPSTTTSWTIAIFSWTFSTIPMIVEPSSGTTTGPVVVFTLTMCLLGSMDATPVCEE